MKSVLQMLIVLSVIVMLIAQFITVPKEFNRELTFVFFGAMLICASSIAGLIFFRKGPS